MSFIFLLLNHLNFFFCFKITRRGSIFLALKGFFFFYFFFMFAAIVNGRFDPHFPLQHQQKDLRLVLGLGDSVEQPLHLAAAANELYKKARRMGYGEGDVASVFKAASECLKIEDVSTKTLSCAKK